MTPKEKADELIRKYYSIGATEVKQCALVEVNDILKVVQSLNRHDTEYIRDEHIPYWEEVKQEIKKL
jgi:hypothetical protein